jgi:hypothetical protein
MERHQVWRDLVNNLAWGLERLGLAEERAAELVARRLGGQADPDSKGWPFWNDESLSEVESSTQKRLMSARERVVALEQERYDLEQVRGAIAEHGGWPKLIADIREELGREQELPPGTPACCHGCSEAGHQIDGHSQCLEIVPEDTPRELTPHGWVVA